MKFKENYNTKSFDVIPNDYEIKDKGLDEQALLKKVSDKLKLKSHPIKEGGLRFTFDDTEGILKLRKA